MLNLSNELLADILILLSQQQGMLEANLEKHLCPELDAHYERYLKLNREVQDDITQAI